MELGAIVLDSGNSEELAEFYARLLEWEIEKHGDEWIVVRSRKGEGLPLVFQEIENYRPPVWPADDQNPQQQMHLDFYVSDVAKGVEKALAAGARLSEIQLEDDWKVLLDPAGHPFCILPDVAPGQEE